MAEPAWLHSLPDHAPPAKAARSRPALFADVLRDQPLLPLRSRSAGWYVHELIRLVVVASAIFAFSAWLWGPR